MLSRSVPSFHCPDDPGWGEGIKKGTKIHLISHTRCQIVPKGKVSDESANFPSPSWRGRLARGLGPTPGVLEPELASHSKKGGCALSKKIKRTSGKGSEKRRRLRVCMYVCVYVHTCVCDFFPFPKPCGKSMVYPVPHSHRQRSISHVRSRTLGIHPTR